MEIEVKPNKSVIDRKIVVASREYHHRLSPEEKIQIYLDINTGIDQVISEAVKRSVLLKNKDGFKACGRKIPKVKRSKKK